MSMASQAPYVSVRHCLQMGSSRRSACRPKSDPKVPSACEDKRNFSQYLIKRAFSVEIFPLSAQITTCIRSGHAWTFQLGRKVAHNRIGLMHETDSTWGSVWPGYQSPCGQWAHKEKGGKKSPSFPTWPERHVVSWHSQLIGGAQGRARSS